MSAARALAISVVAAVGLSLFVLLTMVAALLGVGGPAAGTTGSGTPGSPSAASIPPAVLSLYQEAAATCPGLSWSVLAAIGTVESANGTSDAPGVQSGANAAGAEGPMQFEPATFDVYAWPVPAGGADPPSPYDPVDAVYAASRLLCADGAGAGDIAGAVFAYNHSSDYVEQVLELAADYAATGP